MGTESQGGFVIRPYRPADALGVRSVLEATYGAEATPASTYDWWSFGFTRAISGFMVAEVSGRVAGVQPMEIFPFVDGTNDLRGGMLTGVAVHPDFRRRGIFSELVKACEAEAWRQGAVFVTTMPNEKSRPGFLKMGYSDLGRRQLLMRPLSPGATGGKMLPVLGQLAGGGGTMLQSLLKRVPSVPGYSVCETCTVGEGIDALTQKHSVLFPGVRLQRTMAWWRWRFLESPLRKYRLLEAHTAGGQLAGLAASTVEMRKRLKVCYLMDLLVSDEEVVAVLMRRICEVAKAEGVDMVAAVVSSAPLVEVLKQSGFWAVPGWLPLKKFYSVARFNPGKPAPASWQTLGGWYQTLADWDNL